MIPISDILIRSMSGYVFMIPVFILYFLWLKKSGKAQSFLHTATVFVFGYYLFGLLSVVQNPACKSEKTASIQTG